MRIVLCLALLLLAISAADAASLPGDSANGMRLFNANCTRCHDTSVLTRPDRRVQSLDALKQQIAGCAHMANKQFSQTETQDLLKYLNDQFYHFGRRGGWWGLAGGLRAWILHDVRGQNSARWRSRERCAIDRQ